MTRAVTLAEALDGARKKLRDAGIETSMLDARLLLQQASGLSAAEILARGCDAVPPEVMQAFSGMVEQRLRRAPVSRILGYREFWDLRLALSEGTLDPRPDSETLVEAALRLVSGREEEPWRILDLGTGTGCLLLALLSELPAASGAGVDLSACAVATAGRNAQAAGLSGRARFYHTSWADFFPGETFDMVISNPPYIPDSAIDSLMPEVRDYDPFAALAGGHDGLEAYRDLFLRHRQWLKPGGHMVLELGAGQVKDVAELAEKQGFYDLSVRKDLAGIERCLTGRAP